MAELSKERPFVFLTGDLGFMALEPLQHAMGARFINAGVAEQNMVSVAAGLAGGGEQVWVYSIAPFVYARPFEQIRNDVCLHDLDVKLVGNGGGYGYGPMGASHHALEDYGTLLTLQHMRVFAPAFAEDVKVVIPLMAGIGHPSYLRLGRDEKPASLALPPYAAWRKLLDGGGPLLLAVGSMAGSCAAALQALEADLRPELWVLTELPLDGSPPPIEFLVSLGRKEHLAVVEEHVLHGGAGQAIAHWLLSRGLSPKRFDHHYARGYPSSTYGSQNFHRKESGLDAEYILKTLMDRW